MPLSTTVRSFTPRRMICRSRAMGAGEPTATVMPSCTQLAAVTSSITRCVRSLIPTNYLWPEIYAEESQKSKACPACASAAGTGERSRRGKRQKSEITGKSLETGNQKLETLSSVFEKEGMIWLKDKVRWQSLLVLAQELVHGLSRRLPR